MVIISYKASQLDKMFKNAQNNQQLYYFILNYTAKGIMVRLLFYEIFVRLFVFVSSSLN
jgi:hypothetical protein